MKKFINRILKIFVVSCMFLSIVSTSAVYAAGSHGGGGYYRGSSSSSSSTQTTQATQTTQTTSANDLKPEDYEPEKNGIDDLVVKHYASRLFSFLYAIAIIVAVIMVMYVGLKYITGSVSEKAEYKKNLVPMAVGALLIAFLFTIIRIVINTAGSI